jgi:hypothetical protein
MGGTNDLVDKIPVIGSWAGIIGKMVALINRLSDSNNEILGVKT